MKHLEFVSKIDVQKQKLFPQFKREMALSKLRDEIFMFLISRENESDYFDLNSVNHISLDMVSDIRTELKEAGWKTELSFGDTGLFIYSTETKPPNCW